MVELAVCRRPPYNVRLVEMLKYFATLIVSCALFASNALAAPLGAIPQIDTDYLRVILDFRSDLWTSPYTYKQSPVRIFGTEVRIPIAHGASWRASANISDESLSLSRTEFPLVDKDIFVGNNLQSQSLGLGFSKINEDTSAFSIVGAYASASDAPYADIRNRYFDGTLTYRTAPIGRHRWVFALNQSNNRGIANGRPFPYLGVLLEPAEEFQAWVGFPFIKVIWQRPGDWKREAEVTPFGAFFDIEKLISNGFLWHSRAAFTLRSYLYENRIEDASRLYYQEMSVEGGVRKALSAGTLVEIGVGYSFDRRIYESDSIYTPRNDKTIVDSDLFGRIKIGFTIL